MVSSKCLEILQKFRRRLLRRLTITLGNNTFKRLQEFDRLYFPRKKIRTILISDWKSVRKQNGPEILSSQTGNSPNRSIYSTA